MSEAPDRIEVEAERVTMTWEDGTTSTFSAGELRAACHCATCREPAGMAATRAVLEGPEKVTVTDARLVGAYAVAFTFGPDGHATGIYPFDQLRAMEG